MERRCRVHVKKYYDITEEAIAPEMASSGYEPVHD